MLKHPENPPLSLDTPLSHSTLFDVCAIYIVHDHRLIRGDLDHRLIRGDLEHRLIRGDLDHRLIRGDLDLRLILSP